MFVHAERYYSYGKQGHRVSVCDTSSIGGVTDAIILQIFVFKFAQLGNCALGSTPKGVPFPGIGYVKCRDFLC